MYCYDNNQLANDGAAAATNKYKQGGRQKMQKNLNSNKKKEKQKNGDAKTIEMKEIRSNALNFPVV